MRAVLERSPAVGVRGEFTAYYLRTLGFKDVEVIGCPSMFLFGEAVHVMKRIASIGRNSAIAMNASAVGIMGDVITYHANRYPHMIYVGQNSTDLENLLRPEPRLEADETSPFPRHASHRLFQEDRVRVCVDPWTWVDYMKRFDFACGARIHGNIAAILAGTPSVVLAHDSRTLELAQYHAIPYRRLDRLCPSVDVAELYDEADFLELNRTHPKRFQHLIRFIKSHGIETVFSDPKLLKGYDKRVESITFPAPMRALRS
jgi:hypothetical protein